MIPLGWALPKKQKEPKINFNGLVGTQGADWGLINQIPIKPLDINPFDITYRESEVSLEASIGASGTKFLQ